MSETLGSWVADWRELESADKPSPDRVGVRIPIGTKLFLGFLAIVALISGVFAVIGVQLIGDRVVAEAQEKVRNDLNTAREIYTSRLDHIDVVVGMAAQGYLLREGMTTGDLDVVADELTKVMHREGLDILTLTDADGKVLLRAGNLRHAGDDQSEDDVVSSVLTRGRPVAASAIVEVEELRKESAVLSPQAHFVFIDTPKARSIEETEQTSGMMLKAAAPVHTDDDEMLGVLYGGVLLNRNFDIVDKIKQTVYEDVQYEGQEIGSATIFQDDLRISTNVRNLDGSRAIGTRVSEEVYDRVVEQGEPWIDRAYVVNNWYITAYEPIENLVGDVIGILYVGVLEQKYTDIQRRAVMMLLGVMALGAVASLLLSFLISRRMSWSISQLVSASREIASGNLDAKVEITTHDELEELADAFNMMASAVKRRDEQLKEVASRTVRKSERLAMVGQLAAGVAHELNNPMQGIVTYSLLMLEDLPEDDPNRSSVEAIVTQANRCTRIVRGLLDFSRKKLPETASFDAALVMEECINLVEKQSLFHNIEIVRDFETSLPRVAMDPTQIQQVLMNLIMNAAEAMEGQGLLTLSTRHVADEEMVEIRVADTGHGISRENMEKVFVPFFTTKASGHGVGLGLAISHKIVREHKGTIRVKSEVGEGTTFTIKLPVAKPSGGENDGR